MPFWRTLYPRGGSAPSRTTLFIAEAISLMSSGLKRFLRSMPWGRAGRSGTIRVMEARMSPVAESRRPSKYCMRI